MHLFGPYDLKNLQTFAASFAAGLVRGDVVFLYGTLGAGKTTFSAALIKSLAGDNVDVTSPTFALLHTYDAPKFTLWHFDLYRLETESELEALGLDDALYDGVSLIEWPQLVEKRLKYRAICIELLMDEDPSLRRVAVHLPQGRTCWFQPLT